MDLSRLRSAFALRYTSLGQKLKSTKQDLSLRGLGGSSIALLISMLSDERSVLCIMDDADEAGYLYSDLVQLLGQEAVLLFPSAYRRAIKYGHRDEASAILRSMVLSTIAERGKLGSALPIIVTYPEALAEGVMQESEISQEHLAISVGQEISQQAVADKLHEWGFERVDYVYEPGQFAIRGSIFDVYAFASEHPLRLDFFGDEIDSLRSFDVESQLSITRHEHISLVPDLASATGDLVPLQALLGASTLVFASDRHYLADRVGYIWQDSPKLNDGEGFDTLEQLQRLLIDPEQIREADSRMCHCYWRNQARESCIDLGIEAHPALGKDYDTLTLRLAEWTERGYEVYLSAATEEQYKRVSEIIVERRPKLALPLWQQGVLHEGFVDTAKGIVLLTEHEIFGRYHRYNLRSDKARAGKVNLSLKELMTFSPGDLVVHSEHGIGRFGGLLTMDLGGRPQEVVKIEYRKGDSIYVNLHSLHKLSHYRSRDAAEATQLSTLGTGAWQRIKEKTKKQIKDIARDLIRLYAKRRDTPGFAFSPDSYLQHELEASFMYEYTPDQAKAIEAVKADMERSFPMDRLLCGDVGFGKTEVAIQAAFKAATDGKQVAVLVPTTVLAYQHYRTFCKRLAGFPVRIEYLSRARSAKATKDILKDLAEGQVDIVIGTHRLTSKDVHFKDLGLLIIDEEQKFGVAVKERLRKLQVNVDTLTMSATPIPRTLQFSLMGARDLSNINTPPANRRPVDTILTRFGAETLAEAVNFELSRNGQVYLVHNRIQNINEVAGVIRREVPDARVAVGHGQMSPAELEQLLLDFGNHEYDVLVATTIIENGIDVPNANTIIINDAHRYGLGELHQLRGRVGRSDRKAFCYLLSPPLATLPEESRRRLRALENFSELGSGVRIALQDLDIRGAGNALGTEQSGFIANMGYETYQKVFEEAVNELKVDEFSELYRSEVQERADHFVVETSVESDLELSLPESYVPSDAERILLYRELDNLSSDEELKAFRERLLDRFGTLPQQAEELVLVPRLRRIGKSLGIEKLILRSEMMSLHLVANEASPYYQSPAFDKLINYVVQHSKRCEFRERNGRHILRIKQVTSIADAIALCEDMTK